MINKLIDKEQEVAMRIIIHTKKMSKAARLLHTNRKYIYRRHLNQSYNHNIASRHLSRHSTSKLWYCLGMRESIFMGFKVVFSPFELARFKSHYSSDSSPRTPSVDP